MLTTCPYCRNVYEVELSYLHTEVVCPECSRKFLVERYDIRKSSPTRIALPPRRTKSSVVLLEFVKKYYKQLVLLAILLISLFANVLLRFNWTTKEFGGRHSTLFRINLSSGKTYVMKKDIWTEIKEEDEDALFSESIREVEAGLIKEFNDEYEKKCKSFNRELQSTRLAELYKQK